MAGAILAVGVVIAALLVFSFVDQVSGVSRFTTNRPVEADLSAGDERTIYAGRPARASFPPEPACQVAEVATGSTVPTTPASSFTLTLGDDEFRSLVHFEVDHDGRYRVSCSAHRARPVPMAVGPRIGVVASIGRIFGAFAVGVASLALSAVTIAVTAVKRNQHRRRLRHHEWDWPTGTVGR